MTKRRVVLLLVAAGASTIACSILYGIRLEGRAASAVPIDCARAALEGAGVGPFEHERPSERWDVLVFAGPRGRVRFILDREDPDRTQVALDWSRINQPWPAADCESMRPWLRDLAATLASRCDALPARLGDAGLDCSD